MMNTDLSRFCSVSAFVDVRSAVKIWDSWLRHIDLELSDSEIHGRLVQANTRSVSLLQGSTRLHKGTLCTKITAGAVEWKYFTNLGSSGCAGLQTLEYRESAESTEEVSHVGVTYSYSSTAIETAAICTRSTRQHL
jgi:hypothetical protein